MKKVILLGTSHSIQRGDNSPESFRNLIEAEFGKSKFLGIAEEIDNGNTYIAERFCNEKGLKYLRLEPDQQERIALGIPSANNIVFEVIEEFDEKHPTIRIWPSDPSPETLPSEVWEAYNQRIETSYRTREAEWLKRLMTFDVWPVLCICGANHFIPFTKLMLGAGIIVRELHSDWEPDERLLNRT